jgi:hypothetical protein
VTNVSLRVEAMENLAVRMVCLTLLADPATTSAQEDS